MRFFCDCCVSTVLKSSCINLYIPVLRALLPYTHKKITIIKTILLICTMSKIIVLDYGSSNLRSVAKALETVANSDQSIVISNKPDEILKADKVVFPGQGAIGQCMAHLKEQELDQVIRECILNKPFLGICLGLQSLMGHSDEDGGVNGLRYFAR